MPLRKLVAAVLLLPAMFLGTASATSDEGLPAVAAQAPWYEEFVQDVIAASPLPGTQVVFHDSLEPASLAGVAGSDLAGFVNADEPTVIHLNNEVLAGFEHRRSLAASLVAHELVHVAVFRSERGLPGELLIGERARPWAAGALEHAPGDVYWQTNEAIAACISNTLDKEYRMSYLSAPCPSAYYDLSLQFLDWLGADTAADWGSFVADQSPPEPSLFGGGFPAYDGGL